MTKVDTDTMVLIIEQFLLLILIMGRFMMPRVLNSICTVKRSSIGIDKTFKNLTNLKPTFIQTYLDLHPGGDDKRWACPTPALLYWHCCRYHWVLRLFQGDSHMIQMRLWFKIKLKIHLHMPIFYPRTTRWTQTRSSVWWCWLSGPGPSCSSPLPSTPLG